MRHPVAQRLDIDWLEHCIEHCMMNAAVAGDAGRRAW